jgi:hypothetical protein
MHLAIMETRLIGIFYGGMRTAEIRPGPPPIPLLFLCRNHWI